LGKQDGVNRGGTQPLPHFPPLFDARHLPWGLTFAFCRAARSA
jgi:hypothetical protein